jgi:hypothetical protein
MGAAHRGGGHARRGLLVGAEGPTWVEFLDRVGDGQWRYRTKRVAFDYFAPLRDGWAPARYALEAARATAHRHEER